MLYFTKKKSTIKVIKKYITECVMIKILIADDKELNRKMLGNYFRLLVPDDNLEISYACNADEAYNLAVEKKPNLVLMDIKMEGENDGIIACRRIKENPLTKDITVWAVTAYPKLDGELAPDQNGFSHFINKPFDPVELIKSISSTLNVPIPDAISQRMGI